MPTPVTLQLPPGDPDAMAALARDVGAAGCCLAAIDARISDAAEGVPGWLGEDASAAAAQMARIDTLTRTVHDAVSRAADRLARHADLLLETRSRVRALRREQDEDFADAWRRWGNLPDLELQVMVAGPGVSAVVLELETRERSRRRRHTALLEGAEDDAAATARVLDDASGAVGAHGHAGDGTSVVAYLAAQLPGWGDRELLRRGRALAGRLTAGTPEEKDRAAADASAFAGSPAFATGLLAALGVDGVAYVLRDLGAGLFAAGGPVARTLAGAFAGAVPGGEPDDPVARVLDAEYVHRADDFSLAGAVATGLAMVLVAGGSLPSGAATRTVARWGRQFLLWESHNHAPIGTRSPTWAPEVGDPTGLAIGIVAERADQHVSAALLDDATIWKAALGRVYDDAGAALATVVAQAGGEPGERGERVLRLGLATAGSGLAGDDPSAWTVNRQTLAAVAPGLGAAANAHVDVVVSALAIGRDGSVRPDQAHVLAGLGYVTLDRGAAAAIEQALSHWAEVRPEALDGTGSAAATVLGAYVAVQESAQRTSHALDALEDRAEAQAKQFLWQRTFGLPASLPGREAMVYGELADVGAFVLHNDGTWVERPDRGLVFGRQDAAALARTALAPQGTAEERTVLLQARDAYDRTAAALPVRDAPVSATSSVLSAVGGVGLDVAGERLQQDHAGEQARERIPHRQPTSRHPTVSTIR